MLYEHFNHFATQIQRHFNHSIFCALWILVSCFCSTLLHSIIVAIKKFPEVWDFMLLSRFATQSNRGRTFKECVRGRTNY